jgi:twitching motility protein PilT
LVFATLHTTGAAKTVDRIIGAFPEEQQTNIRTQLSTVLQGVVSQLLIPRCDQAGRTAIFEVMVTTPAIANCIRENKLQGIADAIQTGRKLGMLTLDDSLVREYTEGHISREEALQRSQVRATVLDALERVDAGRVN